MGKIMISEIPVPVFKDGNFEMFEKQVEEWARRSGVDKKKQAAILWLWLPDENAENIKTKIYNEMKDDLKKEVGVQKLLDRMAKAFKTTKQSQVKGEEEKKTEEKLEEKFHIKEEEARSAARGYYRGPQGRGGAGNNGAGGGRGGWSGTKAGRQTEPTEKEVKRPMNPTGQDGGRFLCLACGSYRHMIQECQYSWESMKGKAKAESSYIPLLWSKPSMVKAGVVLPKDGARTFGSWTDPVTMSEGEEEKKAIMVKPHPRKETMAARCDERIPRAPRHKDDMVRVVDCRLGSAKEAEEREGDDDSTHSEHSKAGEDPEASPKNATS